VVMPAIESVQGGRVVKAAILRIGAAGRAAALDPPGLDPGIARG
jgi:hypothetical protein